MLKKNEKKGLIIYLGTVFGITLLMGFLIRVAFQNNQPISSYAGVQMMYPAMGVIIAVFFTRKDIFQKMKRFYLSYLIVGVVCIIALDPQSTISGSYFCLKFIIFNHTVLSRFYLLLGRRVRMEVFPAATFTKKIRHL